MRFSENRRIAWAVLAVCVIGSIFGLGGSAMVRERNAALTVFNQGTVDSEHCMDIYLDDISGYVKTMGSEAARYLGEDNENAQTMLSLTDALKSDDVDARYDAYRTAKQCSKDLYVEMDALNLSDDDWAGFYAAYNNFMGHVDMINRDPYSEEADAYNSQRSGFPASLVTDIWGAGELDSFDA